MNILYVLQQSIYNNNSKWISADSNINMMVGVFKELVRKTDWEFYVLIAPIEDFEDINSYDEIFKHEQVHFVPYNFPIDAFLNRQHFNIFHFDFMYKALPTIDIVWNNIIELSRNIKTYLFQNSKNTKLISCCYWMDTPEINEAKVDNSISYQYRQFDGYECSDLCIFTCKSTKEAFFNNAKKLFNFSKIKEIKKKSFIWDFGFSKKEANKYKLTEKFDKTTILFLNRLSGINYTHHEEFINAVNELYKERQDFQVVFTNPSGKYSFDELRELVNPLYVYKEHSLSRQEYFNLLWKSDISFHGFTKERYGGCSHRESIHCNNIIVSPEVFEYKAIQGNEYSFYVNTNFSNLKEILNKAIDFKGTLSDSVYKNNNNSSFEKISTKVIKNIEILNKKV